MDEYDVFVEISQGKECVQWFLVIKTLVSLHHSFIKPQVLNKMVGV